MATQSFRSWPFQYDGGPQLSARVYYAYSIKVNGVRVGTFQTFNPQSTRQVLRVRGIANNRGIPFELAPGPADLSFTINFLSLYTVPLAIALGQSPEVGANLDLNKFFVPFTVDEICHFPDTETELVKYKGCQIRQISRTINQGTVQVVENATIDAVEGSLVKGQITYSYKEETGITPPFGTPTAYV